MDATRRMFAQKVSYTGLSVQAVLDTEAAVYSGQEAIDAGLADELSTAPMRSPLCVMHWMHINPVSQGE